MNNNKIFNIYISRRLQLIFTIVILFTGNIFLAQNFNTEGNGIRNSITANIKGKTVLYFSELAGNVSAYTIEGKKIWETKTDKPAVLFEINAVDVNNDKNDDLLAASADGNIYCWDSSGKLLQKYNPGHKIRFSEIAVVNNDNKIHIFRGF